MKGVVVGDWQAVCGSRIYEESERRNLSSAWREIFRGVDVSLGVRREGGREEGFRVDWQVVVYGIEFHEKARWNVF